MVDCFRAKPALVAMNVNNNASLALNDKSERSSRGERGLPRIILLVAWSTPITTPSIMIGAQIKHRVRCPLVFVSKVGTYRLSDFMSGTFAQVLFKTTSPEEKE
jgi:hypothetical protein